MPNGIENGKRSPEQFCMIATLKKMLEWRGMISLRGVAVHNLKNIDLDLPIGKLIVFCGRSGSGKSSLALDTLYAEGQRRYIETFSPAMRQFLEKVEKPKAERLDGIPPAIAVTSHFRKTDSTTVGDATELSDYLAMLFANVGHVFCPKCSRPITADTPQTIWQWLNCHSREGGNPDDRLSSLDPCLRRGDGVQIAFAPPLENTSAEFAALWKEQGFLRGCYKNRNFRLDEPIPDELYQEGLQLIVDRLTLDPTEEDRCIESLETAFEYGDGKCFILLEQQSLAFSRTLSCEYCNVHVPPLTAKLFRTDWINHVHLQADVNSPTMNDLCRLTVAELLQFFDEIG
jgi:excinuclease ABC subunit A